MKPDRRSARLSVSLVCAVLSACALAGRAQLLQPSDLVDSQWGDAEKRISLSFDREGGFVGFAGCNRLRGKARMKHQEWDMGRMISTKMACSPEVMEAENRLYRALSQTRQIRRDRSAIELLDGQGAVLWRLDKR